MKKIPYGIANFEAMKEHQAYYYVDKTRYIAELEKLGGKFLFFLRPRRFGKSLFVSMLEYYYDISRASQFDELFGDTWIARHPTPLKNSLPILKLNFSGIPTHTSGDELIYSFTLVIRMQLELFFSRYGEQFGLQESVQREVSAQRTAGDMLNSFIGNMMKADVRYYLLIDEYDNFANNILIHHGKDNYIALTHKGGFLRSFFAAIKNATESRTVERMFVTGVSPLVLSDVTSGMNIGDNISSKSLFNSMLGFDQTEVETLLDYYIAQGVVPLAERIDILDLLRANYNNYCFSERTAEKVYNSDMVLYFFNNYIQENKIPSNLIDENVRIDYGKLQFLIAEGRQQSRQQSRRLNGNFNILSEILDRGDTACELVHSFAIKEIIDANKFKSFLYYLGLLSIKEYSYGSRFTLSIPNQTIQAMHYTYLREALIDGYGLKLDVNLLTTEFDALAFEGRWRTIIEHIIERLYEAVSLRDFVFREQVVKAYLLSWLGMTPLYFVLSEPELNHGYADIFLQKNHFTTRRTSHEYLIEVKFLSSDEQKASDAVAVHRKQAAAQLERYAAGQTITCQVHKIIVLAGAKELLLLEEV